ncbi:hypothetical protein CAC42_5754 [Sphaceloma murrayae]|uniref:Dynactin subunit 2 n=1 Tax=Sphaceloma murrayae TaxID=2082308 RepID=A0A2K1QZ21_9PEZI|nr:hypothetical protein CAC42_5754 [Sphaceloma murrayae]
MAQVRKYAHLVDIDDAPDVYESPEVEDDAQAPRSPSVSDAEENDDAIAGVTRSRLQLDQARNRFESSRVDASAADFSDRVSAKKQSYIVSTRAKKKGVAVSNGRAREEYESDEEMDDDESLARRIARLNREIEQVKVALRQREDQQEFKVGTQAKDNGTASDINALNRALDSIHESQRQAISAHARLARQLAESFPQPGTAQVPAPPQSQPQPPIDEDTLSKIASFDARLSSLETSLGLQGMDMSATSSGSVVPILPTLSLLDQQLALLTANDNIPNLEAKLKALQALSRDASPPDATKDGDEASDDTVLSAEDIAQLRSLYALIPTLSELAPSVPALLSRLRSLRHLHADAAQAGQLMSDLERRQDDMDKEIKAWRTGIEKVEEAVKRAEAGFKGNVDEVEKWVGELEGKLKSLD